MNISIIIKHKFELFSADPENVTANVNSVEKKLNSCTLNHKGRIVYNNLKTPIVVKDNASSSDDSTKQLVSNSIGSNPDFTTCSISEMNVNSSGMKNK